jgi:transglutaminase-like putative cysteine protease
MRLGETKTIQTYNLTEDTVGHLLVIARTQAVAPEVRRVVESIVRGIPEKQWSLEMQGIFAWVKNNLRYLRDPEGTEYVQTPIRHIINVDTNGASFGDCDDASLLLATLLRNAGFKVKFVIISSPGHVGPGYNHIYVEALDPSVMAWIPLDATMKDKPYGWKPSFNRKKEFLI